MLQNFFPLLQTLQQNKLVLFARGKFFQFSQMFAS